MSEPPGEGKQVVGGSQVDASLERVGRRVMFTETTRPGRSNQVQYNLASRRNRAEGY